MNNNVKNSNQSAATGNHSCIPNTEASFPENNFLLHLSALSDISPGEVSGGCWVVDDALWLWRDWREHPAWPCVLCCQTPLGGWDCVDRNGFVSLSERLRRPSSSCYSNINDTAEILIGRLWVSSETAGLYSGLLQSQKRHMVEWKPANQ